MAALWAELLKLPSIGRHDNFFALGGHSLLASLLIARVNRLFQLNLPLASVFNLPTVAQMAAALLRPDQPEQWFSLFPIQTGNSEPRLFWMDYPNEYGHEIIQHLGASQAVYGLRYGIGSAADARLTLPALQDWAAQYLADIRALQPQGPYFLLGHCYGGILAYELARQLQAAGQQVGHVIMIDSYVPGASQAQRLPLAAVAANIVNNYTAGELLKKSVEAGRQALLRQTYRFRQPDYRPDQFNMALVQTILRNYDMPAYQNPVTLFYSQPRSLRYSVDTPDKAWKVLIGEKFTSYEVLGGHTGLMQGEGAVFITEKIRQIIGNARHDQA